MRKSHAMPALVRASPVPLFERLVDGAGAPPAPWQDDAALRESVARELGRLLNTRSRLTAEAFLEADGTVLDYGVPDFSARSLRSDTDREAIVAQVLCAIGMFEPRLRNARARFAGVGTADPVLLIDGELRLEAGPGRVGFELAVGSQSNGRVAGQPGSQTGELRWTGYV
jgi:type VI secretion system protein ImpF